MLRNIDTFYWSSTPHGIDGAYTLSFNIHIGMGMYGDNDRMDGVLVRCVAE